MAAVDFYPLTQQLYIAYFGRPADPRGLETFAAALAGAGVPKDIVSLTRAYLSNAAVKSLVDGFGISAESAQLYPSADPGVFVDAIFLNVLGRHPKPAGLSYWTEQITSGRVSKAEAAMNIMAGAYANTSDPLQAKIDMATIDNKVAAASYFTDAIDTVSELLAYKGAASAAMARSMLAGVLDTTNLTAFHDTVEKVLLDMTRTTFTDPGLQYALTIGTDTIVGTSGGDQIKAGFDSLAARHTASALDSIDGGGGTDTLSISDPIGGLVDLSTMLVKNVEVLNVVSAGTLLNRTADISAYAGLLTASIGVKGPTHTISANADTALLHANSAGGVTVIGGKSLDLTVGNSAAALAAAASAAAVLERAAARLEGLDTLAGAVAAPASSAAVASATTVALDAGVITASEKARIDQVSMYDLAYVEVGLMRAAASTAWLAAITASSTATAAAAAAQAGDGVLATSNDGLTSASVKNGSTVTITDGSLKGDTLAAVWLDNNSGAATLTGNALTKVSIANTTQDTTIVNGSTRHPQTIALNNVSGATIADVSAGPVTINAGTAKSIGLNLDIPQAYNLHIDTAVELSFSSVNAPQAGTLLVTGAGTLAIGAGSQLGALELVEALYSGGVKIAAPLGNSVSLYGGIGSDAFTVGANTKAIDTNAGDDVVSLTTSALGRGGRIDAGWGTDTLVMTAANAATATAGIHTLADALTGFERLSLTGVAGQAIDLANLDDLSYVKLDSALGATLNNLASGATVVLDSGAGTLGVNLKNALNGGLDVLTIQVSNSSAQSLGTITAPDIETVNFVTDDVKASASGIAHTVTLVDPAVKAIVITGDAGLDLGNLAGTALTRLDASGVSKGMVSVTVGALGATATIRGGADANTVDFAAALKAVAYAGGAGIDTVTAGDGDNTLSTGAGNDRVVLGAGRNTVDLGAGDDTVTLGANASAVTGGAGRDHFIVTSSANGDSYSTIADFAIGEDLSFGGTNSAGKLGAKIALGTSAAFADYLNAAAAGTSGDDVKWFVYAGATYIVNDTASATAFANGTDQIVKLAGVLDLTASLVSANGVFTYGFI